MKRPQPQETWPELWRECYFYDLGEVYGEPNNLGYANAYANRRAQTLRMVERVLRPGESILDVAAAQGNFTLALAEKGYRVTWNDLRGGLVDYVKQKHEFGDVRYAPGNVFELAFDEPFDAVLITEIIEHVAHPDDFLRKVSRLVRPGGHIIMTTPNGGYFKNALPKFSECADPSLFESSQFKPNADGHIFLLHPEEIRALAEEAGLEVVELRLFTNPLTSGHMKTEALLRVLPKAAVAFGESLTAKLPESLRAKALVHTAALFRVK
jgi:2-polyprenyl-6-hydroxyphenyl methylase/3-demethylubiquinone-9 3-methyltransferase